MYKYLNKYYDQHQRNDIWRNINEDKDVEMIINGCIHSLKNYEAVSIPHRIREDKEYVEKNLGEFEMAIKRIKDFPQFFSFTQEDIENMEKQFVEFEEKLHQLDMQRISWD